MKVPVATHQMENQDHKPAGPDLMELKEKIFNSLKK